MYIPCRFVVVLYFLYIGRVKKKIYVYIMAGVFYSIVVRYKGIYVCTVYYFISPAQSPNTSGAYERARADTDTAAAGDVTAAVSIAPVAPSFPHSATVRHQFYTERGYGHSLPFASSHSYTDTPQYTTPLLCFVVIYTRVGSAVALSVLLSALTL